MSVRTNWVEDGFALINGAATFITLADQRRRAHEVNVVLPSAWRRVMTAMPDAPERQRHAVSRAGFRHARGLSAGHRQPCGVRVHGRGHETLPREHRRRRRVGRPAIAKDLEKIVQQARALWGPLPYEKYLFLNLITESGGGIEHKGSTVLMSSRWATRTRRGYLGFLRLASHEYFHVWNVKRLRPVELGPFDYEHEVYTKALWMSEGFTDYYGALQLRRAGLQTEAEFLEELSGSIQQLQTTPGRLVQPVEMASFDAWIKEYRPDENSINIVDQLLHEGRGHRVPARREDSDGDGRKEDARRPDAPALPALLRRSRFHRRRLPQRRPGSRRDGSRVVVHDVARHHRGARLHGGAHAVRLAFPRPRGVHRQGVAGRDDQERRGPRGDHADAPRHARLRCGPQRGRRDSWRLESFEFARADYPRGSNSTIPGTRSRCSSPGATN